MSSMMAKTISPLLTAAEILGEIEEEPRQNSFCDLLLDAATAHCNFGALLCRRGHLEESLKHFKKTIEFLIEEEQQGSPYVVDGNREGQMNNSQLESHVGQMRSKLQATLHQDEFQKQDPHTGSQDSIEHNTDVHFFGNPLLIEDDGNGIYTLIRAGGYAKSSLLVTSYDKRQLLNALAFFNMSLSHYQGHSLGPSAELLCMVADISPDPALSFLASNNLGCIHLEKGNPFEALYHFSEAIDIALEATTHEPNASISAFLPSVLMNKAYTLIQLGDIKAAGDAIQDAEYVLRASNKHGENYLNCCVEILHLKTTIGLTLDDDALLLKCYEALLGQAKMTSAGTHLSAVSRCLNKIGAAFARQEGKANKASAALLQALKLRITAHGEQHISVAETLHELGSLHLDQGETFDALSAYRRSLSIQQAVSSGDCCMLVETMHNISQILHHQGSLSEALEMNEGIINTMRETFGVDNAYVSGFLMRKAQILHAMGRTEEATEFLHEASRDGETLSEEELFSMLHEEVQRSHAAAAA